MNPSDRAILQDQLLRDEGLRLKPYKDTVGKLTIGIGRNLDDKGISKNEAQFLFRNDLDEVLQEARETFWWFPALTPQRQAVVVNMLFNLGKTRLLGFKKALKAIEESRWADAAREMLDSKWAQQVGDRAKRLARQMETSQWV